MITTASKISLNRLICLVLATVFLFSFPAGTSAFGLCLDSDKIHVIAQTNPIIADCHSSSNDRNGKENQAGFTLVSREANDCLDFAVSGKNVLRRPSEITLPAVNKVTLSYMLPGSRPKARQQLTGYNSSAFIELPATLPYIDALRSVILLI